MITVCTLTHEQCDRGQECECRIERTFPLFMAAAAWRWMLYWDRKHGDQAWLELECDDEDPFASGSPDDGPEEGLNVVEIPAAAWTVLPSAPGTCPECATEHDPRLPHNQQSITYQVRFNIANGRGPTWADAMAHCTDEVKRMWTEALASHGVEV